MGLSEMYAELMNSGYLIEKDGKYELTPLGISIGGESKPNRYKKVSFIFYGLLIFLLTELTFKLQGGFFNHPFNIYMQSEIS